MLRALLFDATGVLITTAEPVGDTYARVAGEYGVTLAAARLDDAFARILRHMPARVFPDRLAAEIPALERAWWRELVRQTFQAADGSVRFADFDAFFGALYDTFARADAWRLTPGTASTLRVLKREGLLTGVVSNFDHRLPNLLESLGIASFLDVMMCPANCGFAKPDEAIFRLALEALDVPPVAALYVGHDPEADAAGASAAGMPVLMLEPGNGIGALPAQLAALATLGP